MFRMATILVLLAALAPALTSPAEAGVAERRVVTLHREGTVEVEIVTYLNRLSDLLFAMARYVNFKSGVADVKWLPPKN